MTPTDLLAVLRARADVRLVDGQLEIAGPRNALSSELRAEVAARKNELVAALEAEAAVADLAADGRDIIAALADRGIVVRLADDDRPLAGPAELIDEVDRVLLAAHRDAVLAALRAGAPLSSPAPERPDVRGERCSRCRQQDYMPLGGGWRRCWSCGWRWGPAGAQDPGDPPDLSRTAALLGLVDVPRRTVYPRAGEELASTSPEAAIDEAASDYPAGVLCCRDGCRGLGWRRDPESGGWRCRACGGALETGAKPPNGVSATPTTPEPIGVLCRGQGCGSLTWRWDDMVGEWRCRKCGGPLPPWLLKAGA